MIGYLRCEGHIFNASSLKEKRSVLKRIITRIRQKYNVSVAETGFQDQWQRFEISIVNISMDKIVIERELQAILSFLDSFDDFDVTVHQFEWY